MEDVMSRLLHLHGVEDQLIKQQLLCRHDREHEDDVREAARYEEDRTRQESRDVEDAKWKDEFAAMERESGHLRQLKQELLGLKTNVPSIAGTSSVAPSTPNVPNQSIAVIQHRSSTLVTPTMEMIHPAVGYVAGTIIDRKGKRRTGYPVGHDSENRPLFRRPSDGKLVYLKCGICQDSGFKTVHALMIHVTKFKSKDGHRNTSYFLDSKHAIEKAGVVSDLPFTPVNGADDADIKAENSEMLGTAEGDDAEHNDVAEESQEQNDETMVRMEEQNFEGSGVAANQEEDQDIEEVITDDPARTVTQHGSLDIETAERSGTKSESLIQSIEVDEEINDGAQVMKDTGTMQNQQGAANETEEPIWPWSTKRNRAPEASSSLEGNERYFTMERLMTRSNEPKMKHLSTGETANPTIQKPVNPFVQSAAEDLKDVPHPKRFRRQSNISWGGKH